jgi:hypothetical protein
MKTLLIIRIELAPNGTLDCVVNEGDGPHFAPKDPVVCLSYLRDRLTEAFSKLNVMDGKTVTLWANPNLDLISQVKTLRETLYLGLSEAQTMADVCRTVTGYPVLKSAINGDIIARFNKVGITVEDVP